MSKIIRSKRNTPFVQIDKTGPEDKTLSWKAKGILAYILCKHDDWQIYISELSKNSKDGKDSTRTGINELIKAGYIVRKRIHDESGKFAGYDYQVYEKPINTTVFVKSENGEYTVIGKTVNGLSVNGKTVNGKPATTNNNLTNNNLTNNKRSDSARENKITEDDLKDFEMLEISIEQQRLKTQKETPSKVAQKVSIEEQMLPNWMQVATDMAEYLKGDGADQWGFLCEAAGGHVEPITITTAWAGKNCDASYPLKNWKNHIPKLTNWIRNELKSNSLHKKKEERYSTKSSTSERLKVKTNGLNRSEIKISKVPV